MKLFCPIQTLSLPFNYFKIISSRHFVVAVAVFSLKQLTRLSALDNHNLKVCQPFQKLVGLSESKIIMSISECDALAVMINAVT